MLIREIVKREKTLEGTTMLQELLVKLKNFKTFNGEVPNMRAFQQISLREI